MQKLIATSEIELTADGVEWNTVTPDGPCQVCGKGDWCRVSPDGLIAACHRITAGASKVAHYDNGQEVGIFMQSQPAIDAPREATAAQSGTFLPRGPTTPSQRNIKRGSPEVLDEINRRLLDVPQLALNAADRKNLRDRGLTDDQIDAGMYRSFHAGTLPVKPDTPEFEGKLRGVPGFRFQEGKWSFVCSKGILIPVFNLHGQIIALKVRRYRPGSTGKYGYATSSTSGGAGPGSPIHCPVKITAPVPLVRVTEGELKSAIATYLSGVLTLSAPGVYGWRRVMDVLKQIGAMTVRVAFDMDAYQNPNVALQLDKFIQALHEANYTVELELWKIELGKGIDDVLAAGKGSEIDVVTGDRVAMEIRGILEFVGAASLASSTPNETRQLRILIVTNEEAVVADRVIEGIKDDPTLYARSGTIIVRIVADESNSNRAIERHIPPPRIQEYPAPALRELVTRYFNLQKEDKDGLLLPAHVPPWLIPAIMARTNLPFRRLEAVLPFPALLADGTVLQQPGYDARSGLYLACDFPISVPDAPSFDDAKSAAAELLGLVADFPFEKPEHRSAWLAFLLTLLARFAFRGPSPLFLIDANVRGSGKTLLAELVALIVLGQSLARMTNPESDEECRKRITALVIRGEMLVLIDNIVGSFGCGSLDAALTGTVWSDRILGKSETVEFPLNITWVASGNNVQVVADTSRRICPIRLQSPEENPENRTGFKFPNITQHVQQNRGRYLSAALTILRAHAVAGRPDMGTQPWGSFEGWSRVVRDALVWCGLSDPARAREEFVQFSDREGGLLAQMIAGWQEMDQDCRGLTVADVIQKLETSQPKSHLVLRSALTELCPPMAGRFNARTIGRKLMHFRGRNCGGKAFDARPDRTGSNRWHVITVRMDAGFAGFEGFVQPLSTAPQIFTTVTPYTHARTRIETSQPNPSNPANPALLVTEGEI